MISNWVQIQTERHNFIQQWKLILRAINDKTIFLLVNYSSLFQIDVHCLKNGIFAESPYLWKLKTSCNPLDVLRMKISKFPDQNYTSDTLRAGIVEVKISKWVDKGS